MSIRLLIAEHHRLFRQSLRVLLERERDLMVVAEAADGREAFDLAIRHDPDLVLMDIEMPNLDGVTTTKLIRGCLPNTKVLLLAMHDEDTRIVTALQAGAFGYILMNVDQADLLHIIRAAYQGEHVLSPSMPDRFARHALAAVRQTGGDSHTLLSRLTDREREILVCAAAGWSNKEISDHLYVSVDTVKTHLHHIYQKLCVDGRVEAILAFLQTK